jgi:hypothetical protein
MCMYTILGAFLFPHCPWLFARARVCVCCVCVWLARRRFLLVCMSIDPVDARFGVKEGVCVCMCACI